jgi:hypothetical protein
VSMLEYPVSTRQCHSARTLRSGAPHCRALPAASHRDCNKNKKECRVLGGVAQYRVSTREYRVSTV